MRLKGMFSLVLVTASAGCETPRPKRNAWGKRWIPRTWRLGSISYYDALRGTQSSLETAEYQAECEAARRKINKFMNGEPDHLR
jgi:hypothetical protein